MIRERVAQAALKAGRSPEDITILAATKTVSPELINYAISKGISCIGENRVQELISKYDDLDRSGVDIQFIGHLQTNKVKQIVGKVSCIQSVDSLKLAREISRISLKMGVVINIMLEINIGKEENKSGIFPEDVGQMVDDLSKVKGIKMRGIMSIPPICDKKAQIFQYFQKIHQISIDIKDRKIDNIGVECLSMGMSDDYQEAIACGSNMIRVGRALFGERQT